MEWTEIKTEYIATDLSIRELAEKHGCSYYTLRNKCHQGGWAKLKEERKAESVRKIVQLASDDQANRMRRLLDVSDKLLAQVEREIDGLSKTKNPISKSDYKALASTIKDIKDIQSIKSKLDIEEQKARIEILKRQAQADKVDDEKPNGVVLMPPIMEKLTPPSEDE